MTEEHPDVSVRPVDDGIDAFKLRPARIGHVPI